jgi:O-antigen/teichoic acid export membrane protein
MNHRDYGALSMMAGFSILTGYVIAIVTGVLTGQHIVDNILTGLMLLAFLFFGVWLTVVGFYYYRRRARYSVIRQIVISPRDRQIDATILSSVLRTARI